MAESLVQVVELGVAIALVASLSIAVLAFSYSAARPAGPAQTAPFVPVPGRRAVAMGAVTAIVALAIVWLPVLQPPPGPEPPLAFGPDSGGGPTFAGTDSAGQLVYVMAQDGVIEYTFNLGNTAATRMTILDASAPYPFVGAVATGVALVPAESAEQAALEPQPRTIPFSIDAGSSRVVTLVIRLNRCTAPAPGPTLVAGMFPSASLALQVEGQSSLAGHSASCRSPTRAPAGRRGPRRWRCRRTSCSMAALALAASRSRRRAAERDLPLIVRDRPEPRPCPLGVIGPSRRARRLDPRTGRSCRRWARRWHMCGIKNAPARSRRVRRRARHGGLAVRSADPADRSRDRSRRRSAPAVSGHRRADRELLVLHAGERPDHLGAASPKLGAPGRRHRGHRDLRADPARPGGFDRRSNGRRGQAAGSGRRG